MYFLTFCFDVSECVTQCISMDYSGQGQSRAPSNLLEVIKNIHHAATTWTQHSMSVQTSRTPTPLMSLVKSTNQRRWRGGDRLKKDFLLPWGMDCVSVPFRGWMGKTKDLSAFERGMVVGARRTGLSVSSCWVFHAQQFTCVWGMGHHPKDIQPTWHICGKHWSQHGPASLWNAFNTL